MNLKCIISVLFFPMFFYGQRSNSMSPGGISYYSSKKIQNHTRRYRNKLANFGSQKAVRRFIFKKGKTAAKRRRRK